MIHELLRKETRPYHERVQRQLNLFSPRFGRKEYSSLLIKLYGFYAPLEKELEKALEKLLENTPPSQIQSLHWPQRSKRMLLLSDLLALNMTTAEIESIPLCHDLPPLQTYRQVLGCLYVTEGSTLGGKVISKHVQKTFGYTEDSGVSFFSSYREQVLPMWQSFLNIVENSATSESDQRELIHSACQTLGKT